MANTATVRTFEAFTARVARFCKCHVILTDAELHSAWSDGETAKSTARRNDEMAKDYERVYGDDWQNVAG